MRQIDYNNSSHTLRLEFPSEWAIEQITGVNITVKDLGASDLVAQTAATLYTATTLASAASSGANTIVLAAGAGVLAEGDRLRLVSPREDVTVLSYAASTKTATLTHPLLYDHASGGGVYPCWATYAIDTSTVATFVENLEMTIEWAPTGIDGAKRIELAQIKDRAYAVSDFSNKFRLLFPTEAAMIGDRINEYLAQSAKQCSARMRMRGRDPDKVVDSDLLDHLYLAYARWMVTSGAGDTFAHETQSSWNAYMQLETAMDAMPIWVDDDLGLDRDDSEVQTMETINISRCF